MESENKNKRSLGSMGEEIAASFLQDNNYEIVNKNFRVGKLGEIDIVAKESDYICFIEVKTRSNSLYGSPSEAVNKKKQRNITRLAQIYLNQNSLNGKNVRFDIVEVILNGIKSGFEVKTINVIKNAF